MRRSDRQTLGKRLLQKPTGAGRLLANRDLRQDRRVGWVYRCLTKSLGGKEVPTGTCPECDADVHVDTDTDKGESVSCEECGTDRRQEQEAVGRTTATNPAPAFSNNPLLTCRLPTAPAAWFFPPESPDDFAAVLTRLDHQF